MGQSHDCLSQSAFKEGIILICFDNFIVLFDRDHLLLLSIDIGSIELLSRLFWQFWIEHDLLPISYLYSYH